MKPSCEKSPSISETESLVLDLLGSQERFGLELVEASGRKLKLGTIYVTLSRMELKGFIDSKTQDPHPEAIGLPRRMYRVTPYGLRVQRAYKALREVLALKPATSRS